MQSSLSFQISTSAELNFALGSLGAKWAYGGRLCQRCNVATSIPYHKVLTPGCCTVTGNQPHMRLKFLGSLCLPTSRCPPFHRRRIGDHKVVHASRQGFLEWGPAGRGAIIHLPLATFDCEDIRSTGAREVAKAEVLDPEARCLGLGKLISAVIRNPPCLSVGPKNVVARIAREVPNCQVCERRADGVRVELLPVGDAAPGDHQLVAVFRENVGPAVAVEISKEKFRNWIGFCAQESPVGGPARGEIPGCTRRQEEILNSVSIEIAHAEAVRRIHERRASCHRIGCGQSRASTRKN